MTAASCSPSAGVHYISDGLYSLGSLGCAVCGHQFPLTTSPHSSASCGNCGTLHEPGTHLAFAFRERQRLARSGSGGERVSAEQWAQMAAAQFFTAEEIAEAVASVVRALGSGDGGAGADVDGAGSASGEACVVRVGQTAVDNRVLEEAFCDSCGTHRMCKSFARQTRSADEGQTIFYQCTVCSSEWQQNS